MYYIYILYSSNYDKYYVGYTDNYLRRLLEHNSSDRTTFTKKYRPWEIAAVFECGDDRGLAIKIEKFIKKQKSRTFLQKMIDGERFDGVLGSLVKVQRVPKLRG